MLAVEVHGVLPHHVHQPLVVVLQPDGNLRRITPYLS